jgi:hypothetical protein
MPATGIPYLNKFIFFQGTAKGPILNEPGSECDSVSILTSVLIIDVVLMLELLPLLQALR